MTGEQLFDDFEAKFKALGFTNIKVEELTGDKPFTRLEDYISQDELRALSDNYKKIAGFSVEAVK